MILLITGEYIAIEHITSIALEDADANDALLNSLTEAGLDKVKKLSDSIDIHENTPHDDLDRAVVEAQECKEFEKELGTRMFDLNAANKWSITSLALRKVIFGISLVDRKSASQMLTYGYNKNILLTLEVYDGYICICREANGSSLFCYVLKDPKSDVVKNEIESVVDSEDILQIPTGYINKHKSEEE